MIDAMVFSRNRPMQLHTLLSSMERLTNLKDVTVLHRYDDQYKPGLQRVIGLHPTVKFVEETDFEGQVKTYLKLGQKFCVFFVDDMIFKMPIDVAGPCAVLANNPNFLTFSMRLGTHLTYCYPNSSQQRVPDGSIKSGFFVWGWKGAEHDWGYPFSVDGHIFRRSELEGWTSHLRFASPNQFESQMQLVRGTFALPDLCFSMINSTVFNMPLNKVQTELNNRSESVSIDEMYSSWMSGMTFDYERVTGLLNDAAHSPVSIPLRSL